MTSTEAQNKSHGNAQPGASTNRDVRFYQPDLPATRITASFRELLSTYSVIPEQEQISHILKVRNQAYESHPYPCLGRFRFIELELSAHPLYDEVLDILKNRHVAHTSSNTDDDDHNQPPSMARERPRFLDLGTCLGQDIRKLLFDGKGKISSRQLYGADVSTAFVDLGYELFRDEEKTKRDQFLTGEGCDVLRYPDESSNSSSVDADDTKPDQIKGLNEMRDSVDIIQATAIFHLFSLEDQKKIARSCLRLLRKPSLAAATPTSTPPSTSTSTPNLRTSHSDSTHQSQKSPITNTRKLILGAQAGNATSAETARSGFGAKVFRHNEQSWKDMWEAVVDEEEWKDRNTSIKVWSSLILPGLSGKTGGGGGSGVVGRGDEAAATECHDERTQQGDAKTTWDSRVVGKEEDGVRWHVFHVWVEFR